GYSRSPSDVDRPVIWYEQADGSFAPTLLGVAAVGTSGGGWATEAWGRVGGADGRSCPGPQRRSLARRLVLRPGGGGTARGPVRAVAHEQRCRHLSAGRDAERRLPDRFGLGPLHGRRPDAGGR